MVFNVTFDTIKKKKESYTFLLVIIIFADIEYFVCKIIKKYIQRFVALFSKCG